jgi:predicted nucleic acid-binding protein
MSAGYLLDTNVPSETLRPMPNPRVIAWVVAQSDFQFVSVVTANSGLDACQMSGPNLR